MAREGMSAYPTWVPPNVMKERLVFLLNLYKNKQLPDDQYLGNMVLETGKDGTSYWVCMKRISTMQRARRFALMELNDLLFAVLGHTSQWCQTEVVDAIGRKLQRRDRIVLQPQYLLCQFGLFSGPLIAAVEKAPVCPVDSIDAIDSRSWRQWSGVVDWQSNLSSARSSSQEESMTVVVAVENESHKKD